MTAQSRILMIPRPSKREAMRPLLRTGRSKRGPGWKKQDNSCGTGHGGQAKKRSPERGAAARVVVARCGVVASTHRGTGLVCGSASLRLQPRPVGREALSAVCGRKAQPLRFCVRAGPCGDVLHLDVRSPGDEPRRAHLHGQHQCAWTGVAAALAAPVLLSVQRGSVGVVDETLAAVAQQSAELVQEVGAETVQVAGRAVSIIVLMLGSAPRRLWFMVRAVLNRLVHALIGNSLPAQLVELGGDWVRLDSKQSACGWAFLQEGACGRCDAAVRMAEQMGLASEGPRPAELRSRALQKGLAAFPSQECFSGLAAKSRELNCLIGLLYRGGSNSGRPQQLRPPRLSLRRPLRLRQQRRVRGATQGAEKAEVPGHGVRDVTYLAGDSYVAAGLAALGKARSWDQIYFKAYSFDAPSILDALEGMRTGSGVQLDR